MDTNRSASNSPGIGLALGWIATTAIAWILIFAIPHPNWKFVATMGTQIMRYEIFGYALLLATAQWALLRSRVRSAPIWIIGTSAAWIIGTWNLVVMGWRQEFLALFWVAIVGGTIAGLAQAWSLRDYTGAAFWIPATVLGSLAGWYGGVIVGFWTLFRRGGVTGADIWDENMPAQAGALVLGLVSATISAPVLIWILRHPKHEPLPRVIESI
jgi:hypothetical protein